MLFAELRAKLRESVASGYVMTGSDIFLVGKSIDLILESAKIDRNSVVRLDEDASLDVINANLRNVSMFGGNTAVVIKGLSDSRVYLRTVKSDKELEKVDCNPMTEDLVVRLIMQNKKFGHESATVLARSVENNYSAVNNEMEKLLSLYSDKSAIDVADVESVVTKTEHFQIYELSNAILRRDLARAERIIENLSLHGVEDYAVFGSLLSFSRRLFYARASKKTDGEVAKFLSVNPYAITATRRDSRHLSVEKVTKIYETALFLEAEIKGGKVLANRAIILLVGEFI